jgi:DNA-binding transcriptional LysR family regulator
VEEPEESTAESFRLGFVPGATPAKWARVWQARHPGTPLLLVPVAASSAEAAITSGELDAALLRPPVDRDVLHAIVLYDEEPVVVVGRDHLLAALDPDETVEVADLADEVLVQPADDVLAWAGRDGAADDAIAVPGRPPAQVPATTADAIALVAAGVGVVVVPRSLARLHHRKDVTARALPAAPTAPVVLAWPIDRADDRHEDLIGIVRGRTVNSSRGRQERGRADGDPTGGRIKPVASRTTSRRAGSPPRRQARRGRR